MLDRNELQWPEKVREMKSELFVFNVLPSLPDDVIYFVQDKKVIGKIVDIANAG